MESRPSQNLDSRWLTQTKFISPRLRDEIVSRRRLLDPIHTAIQNHSFTLVSAPAGYGKTTHLTSLVSPFPATCIAWISLDEEDNAPARFLAARIRAFQSVNPLFGTNLHALLTNLADPANDAGRLMGVLTADIRLHSSFSLALDYGRNSKLNDARFSDRSPEIFECLTLCW